jgi:catechol 2,3-dioxygenase-like lactoylglutathione lyase family enzyme
MPTDHVAQPWTARSALIAVADLDRSLAFYRELGPFDLIVREDNVAVLGEASPESFGLILRQTSSIHATRHGQQSLGLRFITFNVGSLGELDRIESQLRKSDLFTKRQDIAEGASEVILGRDPDNLPLVFVYYAEHTLGPDYYRTITNLVYSLDA